MDLKKKQLRISITSICNMKCVYCHNEGNKDISSLTKNQVKEIVDKYTNVDSIRITGGEPLISPYIEDICKMLTEEYKIKVEINTNGIEIEKIIKLINKGWVKKIVVGLDYFDKKISKNSQFGKSSEEIKNNILLIKNLNCEVCIDAVYNEEDDSTENIIKWALDKDIQVRVIEIAKNRVDDEYSNKYMLFENKVISKIDLNWQLDDEMKEWFGIKNNKTMIKFYHSLCRLNACEICAKLPLRITSRGKIKSCLWD